MPILQDLRALMADTVTLEPKSSKDVNAQITFGAAVTYTCFVEGQIHKAIDMRTGEERTCQGRVILDRQASISPDDRLTLPTRFNPRKPRIVAVEQWSDEGGTTGTMAHTVLHF